MTSTADTTETWRAPVADPDDPHPRQWRLARVDVVNWGTFTGLHHVDVSRKGHLVTGHSGSGKSSLLDAISTVLTPPKLLRFNAAAQEASSRTEDRSVVSYLRGAWSRQTDAETGEGVSQYLRTGATWSGVLLRFEGGSPRTAVNLIRLFHLRRGSTARGDVAQLNVIVRGEVGLLDFEHLTRNGIETRKIKAAWPEATVTDQHSVFAARFVKLLGIGDGRSTENALQLLHKTQSAKNLGSLDDLFRTFMLETPRTFSLAETAVDRFASLAEAHRLVVEARRQADHLRRLQVPADAFVAATSVADQADTLLAALDDYRDRRLLEIDRADHSRLLREQARGLADHAVAEASADRARREADSARLRVQQAGGAALDVQNERVASAVASAGRVAEARERQTRALAGVGVLIPANAEEFAELRSSAGRERAELALSRVAARDIEIARHDDRAAAAARLRELRIATEALRGRRTNISPPLLRARTEIAAAMGVPEATFRFVGELLDVAPGHEEWTGAIERVLRPLAPTLLVRDEYIDDFVSVVDGMHLGTRLVYESVPARSEAPRPARSARSLINRVRLAEGLDGSLSTWLAHRLADRYDYDCVDDVRSLRTAVRGVTRAGQVKHGARRFEKDDRHEIDDRREWMLGSDNTAKLDALLADVHEQKGRLERANAALERLAEQRRVADNRVTVLAALDAVPWAELDAVAAVAAADAERAQLERLREGNADLAAAQRLADEAAQRDVDATADLRAATASVDRLAAELATVESHIERSAAVERSWTISDAAAAALDERFRSSTRSRDREHVFQSASRVQTQLSAERKAADDDLNRASRAFEALAIEFRRAWPTVAADVTESVGDRDAYSAIHQRIVSSGLPAHEGRFFDLLREQSQQLTGELLNEIRTARRAVLARIEPVNASLLRSPFDTDRFLQIQVRDRRTDEVKDFMDDLKSISSGAWNDDDVRTAEKRFALLQKVMERLGTDSERAWRRRCLDTREHVTFVGVEQAPDGTEKNRHDSGAGLSGGQRQKLVIFCLAAALRYQLADRDALVPEFGTIVLDEAFDKADSEFTGMAMDVFSEFGFHMILATPLKLLQTLERYVGGVSYVSCEDHRRSSATTMAFEDVPR